MKNMNKLWWIDSYQKPSQISFWISKEIFEMKKWYISISEEQLKNLKLSFSKNFPYYLNLEQENWVATYFDKKNWLVIQFFDDYKWTWPALRFEFWDLKITKFLKMNLYIFDDEIRDDMDPYKISQIILKKIVNYSEIENTNIEEDEKIKYNNKSSFTVINDEYSDVNQNLQNNLENNFSWNSFENNVEKQRNNNFSVVWDVDWDWWNFERMSIESWIMDRNWNWINGNNKAIYLWDILADRWVDGLKILQKIKDLKSQANSQGWDVEVIAWNHDEFLFWYLSLNWVNLPTLELSMEFHNGEKYGWLWRLDELDKYWDIKNPKQILKNMKTSSEWISDLENMTNMKLCVVSWDTIFFHTPPVSEMFNLLFSQNWNTIEEKVENLNKTWNEILTWVLLNNWANYTWENYKKYADTFLNTWNDVFSRGDSSRLASQNKVDYEKLKNFWINNLIYWHTDNELPKNISWVNTLTVNRKSMKKVDWDSEQNIWNNDENNLWERWPIKYKRKSPYTPFMDNNLEKKLDFSRYESLLRDRNISLYTVINNLAKELEQIDEIEGSSSKYPWEYIAKLFRASDIDYDNINKITRSYWLRDIAKIYVSRLYESQPDFYYVINDIKNSKTMLDKQEVLRLFINTLKSKEFYVREEWKYWVWLELTSEIEKFENLLKWKKIDIESFRKDYAFREIAETYLFNSVWWNNKTERYITKKWWKENFLNRIKKFFK